MNGRKTLIDVYLQCVYNLSCGRLKDTKMSSGVRKRRVDKEDETSDEASSSEEVSDAPKFNKKSMDEQLEDTYIKTAMPEKNSYHLTRIVLVKYLAFIYC